MVSDWRLGPSSHLSSASGTDVHRTHWTSCPPSQWLPSRTVLALPWSGQSWGRQLLWRLVGLWCWRRKKLWLTGGRRSGTRAWPRAMSYARCCFMVLNLSPICLRCLNGGFLMKSSFTSCTVMTFRFSQNCWMWPLTGPSLTSIGTRGNSRISSLDSSPASLTWSTGCSLSTACALGSLVNLVTPTSLASPGPWHFGTPGIPGLFLLIMTTPSSHSSSPCRCTRAWHPASCQPKLLPAPASQPHQASQ